jgi:hypothetical protein
MRPMKQGFSVFKVQQDVHACCHVNGLPGCASERALTLFREIKSIFKTARMRTFCKVGNFRDAVLYMIVGGDMKRLALLSISVQWAVPDKPSPMNHMLLYY